MRQKGKLFITVKEVKQIWLFVWFSLEKIKLILQANFLTTFMNILVLILFRIFRT